MKLVLSPQRQRLLALAMMAVVVLLAFQLVLWPLWEAAQLHGQRVALLRRQVDQFSPILRKLKLVVE